jgi:cytidine deaminase
MSEPDVELLGLALKLLDSVYEPAHHEVVAALRTVDGKVHLGVHVEASVGRASLCAEGGALSAAIVAGAGEPIRVESIVSVLRRRSGTTHLIEPCGVCAELLSDVAPDARAWVAVGPDYGAITLAELLPTKRLRRDRPTT